MNTALALPFEENKHIKELTAILSGNGMNQDAKDLSDVAKLISSMERELGKALKELTSVRNELSAMRDEQNHPVKTMLHKAADSIMARIKAIQKQLVSIKDKIVSTCKQAVQSFKDNGVIAINTVADVLNIKNGLESMRSGINNAIVHDEKQIVKLEEASKQYHSAGLGLRNIGRVMTGKEPMTEIKPNGKLAKLVQSPFSINIKCLKKMLASVDTALVNVQKLEKAAEVRRPSIHDEMKQKKEELAQRSQDAPKITKIKTAQNEI